MAACPRGHTNPEGQYFCGECAAPLTSGIAICPHGHLNSAKQPFCGECGAPVAAPDGTSSSNGRWSVDPGGIHQYRYWADTGWSDHVVDNGSHTTEAPAKAGLSNTEKWVGAVAGAVTVVLLAGAVSAIVTQFSDDHDRTVVPVSTLAAPEATVAAPPPPPPAAPADSTAPWPLAVIGANCRPFSNDSATADGSVAYCVRVGDTPTHLWSLFPAEIPVQPPGTDPSTAVCMAQTGRDATACAEYLQRPSDPGDAKAPST